jgi:hypothetical protein
MDERRASRLLAETCATRARVVGPCSEQAGRWSIMSSEERAGERALRLVGWSAGWLASWSAGWLALRVSTLTVMWSMSRTIASKLTKCVALRPPCGRILRTPVSLSSGDFLPNLRRGPPEPANDSHPAPSILLHISCIVRIVQCGSWVGCAAAQKEGGSMCVSQSVSQ